MAPLAARLPHPAAPSASSQIGRSTENPIDLVVSDTLPGGNQDGPLSQSTISRFACRIICQRKPPCSARIYAAGFDSSKNIFLGVRPRSRPVCPNPAGK